MSYEIAWEHENVESDLAGNYRRAGELERTARSSPALDSIV